MDSSTDRDLSDFWRVELPLPELSELPAAEAVRTIELFDPEDPADVCNGVVYEVSTLSMPLCGHDAESFAEMEAWNKAEQERREAELAALSPLDRFRLESVGGDVAVGAHQGRHRRARRRGAARRRGSRRGASRGDPDDGESDLDPADPVGLARPA